MQTAESGGGSEGGQSPSSGEPTLLADSSAGLGLAPGASLVQCLTSAISRRPSRQCDIGGEAGKGLGPPAQCFLLVVSGPVLHEAMAGA